jgi:hypothetical protein
LKVRVGSDLDDRFRPLPSDFRGVRRIFRY